MNITKLELLTANLQVQKDFYENILQLPVKLSASNLEVAVGETNLIFTQASSEFEGAYHFAFNIPENQFRAAKKWISERIPLLRDENGKDEFNSDSWNSDSVYFKDTAGNVLEFIARHNLNSTADRDFDSTQILNISEIGLPSENVIELANVLCTALNLSVFKQGPNETFTPVGDDRGLLILPVKNR
ncbi:MAG TPA: hypothetical protein VKB04_05150, partial [Anaerolineales bacterium]|nr:hypothetical protein [Anaerolineales bacterium]